MCELAVPAGLAKFCLDFVIAIIELFNCFDLRAACELATVVEGVEQGFHLLIVEFDCGVVGDGHVVSP